MARMRITLAVTVLDVGRMGLAGAAAHCECGVKGSADYECSRCSTGPQRLAIHEDEKNLKERVVAYRSIHGSRNVEALRAIQGTDGERLEHEGLAGWMLCSWSCLKTWAAA